ncbi:hypothetical protein [Mesorhizobium sp. L-2-11]|uniref:hypothetical protein n=1 Tax=Mesorhizobium sp. L-2-11 TaxID=2744521 RepID=UPI001928706F
MWKGMLGTRAGTQCQAKVFRLPLAATGGYAAFDAVHAVEQFLETVGNVVLSPESRQRTQKAYRRLGAELAPQAGREPLTFFVIVARAIIATVAIVAGRHLKILYRFRNSRADEWFPHRSILASKAGGYSKI